MMLKKWLMAAAVFVCGMQMAFAQVDLNQATAEELMQIKGIGPALSQQIMTERKKNGAFKSWKDFESRVTGIGEKSVYQLSESGLKINGKAKWGTNTRDNKFENKSEKK